MIGIKANFCSPRIIVTISESFVLQSVNPIEKMTRLVFLTLYLLLATSYSTSVQGATEPLNSNVEFAIVHNLTTFLAQNLGAKPLYQLSKTVSEGPSTKLIINYTLGRRVGGDSLVGTGSGSQQWGSPQDVRLTINYPRSGVGAVVSFVFVTVEQVSNLKR